MILTYLKSSEKIKLTHLKFSFSFVWSFFFLSIFFFFCLIYFFLFDLFFSFVWSIFSFSFFSLSFIVSLYHKNFIFPYFVFWLSHTLQKNFLFAKWFIAPFKFAKLLIPRSSFFRSYIVSFSLSGHYIVWSSCRHFFLLKARKVNVILEITKQINSLFHSARFST